LILDLPSHEPGAAFYGVTVWAKWIIDRAKTCEIRFAEKATNRSPGGESIRTIGVPDLRSILLTSTVMILAGTLVFALQHELRPRPTPQAALEMSPRPEPRALTAEEESYAASLWEIHREVTTSAVSMSFAGIVYETETHDAGQLGQKIEPIAKFFGDAEQRVRGLSVPASLSKVHGQYLEAVALYRKAGDEMLEFTKDGGRQHLIEAQRMGFTASEDILRAGEVLWPGQYKPH
jgi:hypothetical protein